MKAGIAVLGTVAILGAMPAFGQQAVAPAPPVTGATPGTGTHADRGGVPLLEPLELQPTVTGPTLRDGASVLLEPRDVLGLEYTREVDNAAHNARLLPRISLTIPFTSPSLK